MTRKRMKQADADALGIRLEDLVGKRPRQTREEIAAELAKPNGALERALKQVRASLTPLERTVLKMRFPDQDQEEEWWERVLKPRVMACAMERIVRERILVWCHSCGCSYDWPWGRCVYQCERCGSGRMSALDLGGQRGRP